MGQSESKKIEIVDKKPLAPFHVTIKKMCILTGKNPELEFQKVPQSFHFSESDTVKGLGQKSRKQRKRQEKETKVWHGHAKEECVYILSQSSLKEFRTKVICFYTKPFCSMKKEL